MRHYWVYILASRSRRLYTGVTNNLLRRMREHREKRKGTFTARYDITRLVYFECGTDIRAAIRREKQIKGWSRRKKLALIATLNPQFQDLAESIGIPRPSAAGPSSRARDSSPLRGSE